MASSPRSRRRAIIEPITVDELMNAAGMSGFVSFLNVPPQDFGKPQVARGQETPTAGVSPTVAVSPTVGENTTVGDKAPKDKTPTVEPSATIESPAVGDSCHEQRPAQELRTVEEKPTVIETPTVVERLETPTVGHILIPPTAPTDRIATDITPAALSPLNLTDITPTVVIRPTVGDLSTPHQTPTVGLPPTVGVSKEIKRERVFRATTVQHGHSSGEQSLFQSMWSSPEARIESTDSRLLTAGYDALARIANLNEKSVRHAIRALLAKLAIEIAAAEQCDLRRGRTYRIFSYRKVLERREAAGMTWVRKTRGVEFIAQPEQSPTVGYSLMTPTDTVGKKPTPTVGQRPARSVGETPTPLSSSLSNFQAPSSSLVAALRTYAPAADDDVASKLASECYLRAPDATDEEIIHFVRLKAQTPGIRLPLGFLLKAVPRCFEGESFRQFRREEQRRRELAARERRAIMQVWQEILEDPESTEELRREARTALEDLAAGRDSTDPS